jgi:hypothetical protein
VRRQALALILIKSVVNPQFHLTAVSDSIGNSSQRQTHRPLDSCKCDKKEVFAPSRVGKTVVARPLDAQSHAGSRHRDSL